MSCCHSEVSFPANITKGALKGTPTKQHFANDTLCGSHSLPGKQRENDFDYVTVTMRAPSPSHS